MPSRRITDGIYSVGVLNPNLRVFDIVMATDFGTTYNSYIVKGEKATALIECCHKRYLPFYLDNIREVCPIEEIDYIILNHCEPDHSGVLAELSRLAPNAQILASQAGTLYLKNITNSPSLNMRAVKDGETLDLGGRALRFISAPFLHWPDSMFTWDETGKTLFPCDFLGAHYCEANVFDYHMVYPDKYKDAFKNYYDAIFGPFASYVTAGLAKIEGLDIRFACTSHGPVLTPDHMLEYAREMYALWSAPQKRDHKLIPVFYTSAYGNTRQIAQAIGDGIRDVLPDSEGGCMDLIEHPMEKLHALLNECDAFALGSPTLNRDAVPPTWQLLAGADAINSAKRPCLVFGSYGWSGEAAANITARLQGLRMKPFGEPFKVCFVPTEQDLNAARALGRAFAQSLGQ
jgi:flavorubredoxin